MRLIDADKLLDDNRELADCDFAHPLYEDTLRDIIDDAPTVEVCEDCISRAEAINVVHKYFVKYLKLNDDICLDGIRSLPSVTPKFTDAEIQKMQELEQAQLEKVYEVAYELGKTEIQPCEDVINREDVINIIEDVCPIYENDYRYILKDKIAQLPSVTPQTRWIPVSERLPETDDEVLATDGIDMFVAWYSRQDMWQGWISSDNNFERNTPIEAWMPLPEGYKAESEE